MPPELRQTIKAFIITSVYDLQNNAEWMNEWDRACDSWQPSSHSFLVERVQVSESDSALHCVFGKKTCRALGIDDSSMRTAVLNEVRVEIRCDRCWVISLGVNGSLWSIICSVCQMEFNIRWSSRQSSSLDMLEHASFSRVINRLRIQDLVLAESSQSAMNC